MKQSILSIKKELRLEATSSWCDLLSSLSCYLPWVKSNRGQVWVDIAFCLVVKPLGMVIAFHIRKLRFDWIQVPVSLNILASSYRPWESALMAQVIRFLPPLWETCIRLLAPSLSSV